MKGTRDRGGSGMGRGGGDGGGDDGVACVYVCTCVLLRHVDGSN